MALPDAGHTIRTSDFEITPTGTALKIPLTGTPDGKLHRSFIYHSEETGTAASGTSIAYSLVTGTAMRVVVMVKGNISYSGDNFGTVTLAYNGTTKDTVEFQQSGVSGGSWKLPFYLHYTETVGSATANIVTSTNGGTIDNFKIVIIKI